MNETTVIKGRWRLSKKLGAGAFGEIFAAVDVVTSEQVAIKLEKCDTKKQVLRLEVAVLKKMQGCPQIARFISCGRSNDYNYVVMELLGENLSDLRRRQPNQRFSVATAARLASQMLRGIQSCHRRGFLHRDIKPSNFALGVLPDKLRTVYTIDFGLARRYRLPTGDIRPPRESAGFRGTARYASVNSHQAKELARRDDLWSLFYVLVEFLAGQLPWRRLKEKDEILKLKLKYTNYELVRGLPSEMRAFLDYLHTLQYETDPDYDYINSLFLDMLNRTGLDEASPYDWELQVPQQAALAAGSPAAPRAPADALPQQGSQARYGAFRRASLAASSQADGSNALADRAEDRVSESVQDTPVLSNVNARFASASGQGMEVSFATDDISVSPAGAVLRAGSRQTSYSSSPARKLDLPSPTGRFDFRGSANVRSSGTSQGGNNTVSLPVPDARRSAQGNGAAGKEISVTPGADGAAGAPPAAPDGAANDSGCCRCTLL